jgi:N-acetyl-gamma-glutamyl-phosphate/LysW-gamma-L-alpha-aminoadipyl-6-phosphate reductase
VRVSLIGGTGYAAGELLRILLQHPRVEVDQVISIRNAGQPAALFHPNLRGLTSLILEDRGRLRPCDLLFVALPNGKSMESMPEWLEKADKVIDLGADFRLDEEEDWKNWYLMPHTRPRLMREFVYGIPEIHPARVAAATRAAMPGCEAIVSILCLHPLLKTGLIREEDIIIDAKMSSSQSGRKNSPATHHPERAGVVRSYQPVWHRHTVEIERCLQDAAPGVRVDISATAVEMVRGILVTIHARPAAADLTEKDVWQVFRQAYGRAPFIRIVKQNKGLYRYPEPKLLQGTNICEIGFAVDPRGGRLVIIGAIDNLVKGTSGNAVQCMNLMAGFPETTGLEFPGLHPV